MSKNKKTVLSIPEELYRKIEEAVKKSDSGSIEEYILKALESHLGQGASLSTDEEEKVKEKLKALGYMD